LAGYSWGDVDKFRKAVGKKIPEEMAKQKEKFVKGCMETSGWSAQKGEKIWSWIEPFAAYGFNKSHSASYAVVSYQTAYMKANYPVEFMAAVMTAESGDETKIYAAVEECKTMGIQVLAPDVIESYGDFTVVDEKTIRFGLNGIKNLGSDVVRSIIQARKDEKPCDTLENFLISCYTKTFNKKSWEALVKAGALDRFGERGQLLANTEEVLDFLRDHFKVQHEGQNSLFGKSLQIGKLKLRQVEPAGEEEKLAWEKEHLGLYVSAHPLGRYTKVLKDMVKIRELTEDAAERMVTIGGIIAKLKRTLTRKNDPMAFFTADDGTGTLEVLVFPKLMPKVVHFLEVDKIVQITGRVSDKDGELKLIAEDIQELPSDELYTMALSEMEKSKQVVIYVNNASDPITLNKIKDVIIANPGNAQVYLHVGSATTGKKIKTKSQVTISQEFFSALKEIPEISMVSEK
jgi:DNA polymerase-3 subunit alpha